MYFYKFYRVITSKNYTNTYTYTQFPPTWGTRWGRLPRLTYVFAFAYVNVYVFVYTNLYN